MFVSSNLGSRVTYSNMEDDRTRIISKVYGDIEFEGEL